MLSLFFFLFVVVVVVVSLACACVPRTNDNIRCDDVCRLNEQTFPRRQRVEQSVMSLFPPPPLSRYCPSLLINSSLYQQHLPVLVFLVFLSFLLSLNNHVVTRERNFKLSSVVPPPTLIDRQEKQSSTYRIMSNPLMGLSKTKESNEKKQSKTKPPKLHCGSRRLLYYSVQV